MPTPTETIDSISGSLASVQLQLTELRKQFDVPTPLPPSPGPIRKVEGLGLMQPGDRQRPLTDAEINHPKVDFVVPRDRWKYLEPTPGSYDFSYLDAQIRRIRKAGKKYVLPVMTGAGCTPDWVEGPRVDGVLAPWTYELRKGYHKLHDQLSNRYAADPLLGMVWITGPTFTSSQEMHTNGWDNEFADFGSDLMQVSWKDSINTIADLYPNVSSVLSISTQKPVLGYLDQVIDHAIKELRQRAVFQVNNLGKQTDVTAPHIQKLKEIRKRGYRIGAEMVQPGNTAGLSKMSELDFAVLYPGDEKTV
jgi:hypothetical protein